MPTTRQIEANRRNALKSTGPKSTDGKARVAQNALKHGLAGHGVVLTDEMTDAIEERKRFWGPEYRPDSPAQRWKFERVCVESVRADACLHRAIALRDERALRASETWDDDRALEAEALGVRLATRPELIQPELLQTRHGALWLVARWEGLADALDRQGGHPTDDDWSRLLDLLGVPLDGREDARTVLLGDEAIEQAAPRIARDALAGLRHRLESYLLARDERARLDAEAGLADDDPALCRLNRYEARILSRMRQAEADLRRMQGGPPAPPRDPRPAPRDDAPRPAPRPDDAPSGPPATPPDVARPVLHAREHGTGPSTDTARSSAGPPQAPRSGPSDPSPGASTPTTPTASHPAPSYFERLRAQHPDRPVPTNRLERRALRNQMRRG